MGRKPLASMAISVVSICVQAIGLSFASSGAVAVAKRGQVNRALPSVAGAASALAIVLALLALSLAVVSWPKEPPWSRALAFCLAVGALLWSLLVV